MSDPDELLARADNESLFIAAVTNGVSAPLSYAEAVATLKQAGRTIEALAAALRAALAARPQPVTDAYAVIRQLTEGGSEADPDWDPDEYGWTPGEAAAIKRALAGPAAPTGDDDG